VAHAGVPSSTAALLRASLQAMREARSEKRRRPSPERAARAGTRVSSTARGVADGSQRAGDASSLLQLVEERGRARLRIASSAGDGRQASDTVFPTSAGASTRAGRPPWRAPSSRGSRARNAVRSEPAPGSEKSWHQSSSAGSNAGRAQQLAHARALPGRHLPVETHPGFSLGVRGKHALCMDLPSASLASGGVARNSMQRR
jgi:hypothetical protein